VNSSCNFVSAPSLAIKETKGPGNGRTLVDIAGKRQQTGDWDNSNDYSARPDGGQHIQACNISNPFQVRFESLTTTSHVRQGHTTQMLRTDHMPVLRGVLRKRSDVCCSNRNTLECLSTCWKLIRRDIVTIKSDGKELFLNICSANQEISCSLLRTAQSV
jgi:hypothetical protein